MIWARKNVVDKLTLSFLPRVGYILNVTREIDNFFPGTFSYHNIRVYDEEATDLLAHWNDTYNFIVKAKWVLSGTENMLLMYISV